MFTHILVPTDFSLPSNAAFEYARTIAARFGASLRLLHVVDDPYRSAYSADVYVPEVEGLRSDLIASANARLKSRLQQSDCSSVQATTDAVIGTPAWSIVEYAAGHDIDLIVMGTHGRSGVSHLLMGSVAEKVVRTALCPVLTVRQALVHAATTVTEDSATELPPALMATSTVDGLC